MPFSAHVVREAPGEAEARRARSSGNPTLCLVLGLRLEDKERGEQGLWDKMPTTLVSRGLPVMMMVVAGTCPEGGSFRCLSWLQVPVLRVIVFRYCLPQFPSLYYYEDAGRTGPPDLTISGVNSWPCSAVEVRAPPSCGLGSYFPWSFLGMCCVPGCR